MSEEELIAMMALHRIPGLGVIGARNLLKEIGSAQSIFANRKELGNILPGLNKRISNALDCPEAFGHAEKELAFIRKNAISCLGINDEEFPSRLRECEDAPILIYYKGNASLNALRTVSIVGTRNITEYGILLCHRFVEELKEILPDIVIISGLAYGVDVHVHRNALICGLPTIGVLAHGLDRIYPSAHRNTAAEMLHKGGLLTEYMSGTNPDRQNFIKRNRIVAGMSDATIVIESASKGGALITAEIAGSYNRDCFAFPGRTGDEFSQGCNNLIRDNKASLIQTAEEFIRAMGWEKKKSSEKNPVIQRELFLELTEEEQLIVEILQKEGSIQINSLVVEADIPVNRISIMLFELEMKGVVQALAGGVYRLMGIK